jgi:hypothetical protein
MPTYKQGDIVLLPYPFSDLSASCHYFVGKRKF